jgi:hypothetical protein
MDIEIIDQPIRFDLHGLFSFVNNNCYGEVGCRLMDEMWAIVKQGKLKTTGINHWVYFAGDRIFVGVEVNDREKAAIPERLEACEWERTRYSKHVHVGPYLDLPQKWQALKAELSARGERVTMPSLEVYGHFCDGDDNSEPETANLIGSSLRPLDLRNSAFVNVHSCECWSNDHWGPKSQAHMPPKCAHSAAGAHRAHEIGLSNRRYGKKGTNNDDHRVILWPTYGFVF